MRKLKLPRKSSKAFKAIHNTGYDAGYNDGRRAAEAFSQNKIQSLENVVSEQARKEKLLSYAGQAINSLAQLSEGFARILMYGGDQRYPKKDEKRGW